MGSDSGLPRGWFDSDHQPLPARLEGEALRTFLLAVDDRLHRQALLIEAMVELLAEAAVMPRDQWLARVRAIDLRDGKEDGRRGEASQRQRCGGCGRTLSSRHLRCLYCGSEELSPVSGGGD